MYSPTLNSLATFKNLSKKEVWYLAVRLTTSTPIFSHYYCVYVSQTTENFYALILFLNDKTGHLCFIHVRFLERYSSVLAIITTNIQCSKPWLHCTLLSMCISTSCPIYIHVCTFFAPFAQYMHVYTEFTLKLGNFFRASSNCSLVTRGCFGRKHVLQRAVS